jgi:murein L,D-transpeptidase YcbB/YkuD
MDLAAYEPIHLEYQRLKTGIQRTREMADEPWPALDLPGGRGKVEAGDTVRVIGSIRHRLHMLGDLEEDGTWPVYDSTLVSAVERFQLRHGLVIDGIIGPAFLRAINVPLAQRLRTMLVNVERLRWVPEEQPPDLLVVNIPEFRLHVY